MGENYRKADLHNHTTGSDGKQSPLRSLLRLLRADKQTGSISDHNSIKGYKQLEGQIRYYAEKSIESGNVVIAQRLLRILDNIKLVPNSELETSYNGVMIEVLCPDIDIDILAEELEEKSQGLKSTKEVLYQGLNRIIDETGITFDRSVIENVNALVAPFYRELTTHEENRHLLTGTGPASTLKEFIDNYLKIPSTPFFIDRSETRPSLEDTIEMIHKAGGKAILAHPGRYRGLDIGAELDELIAYGLDGIEVFYPDHTPEFQQVLLEKVREHGLIVSGGSDDHANMKEGRQYRIGGANTDIPQIPETEWIEDTRDFITGSEEISTWASKLRELVRLRGLRDSMVGDLQYIDAQLKELGVREGFQK